MRYIGIDWGEKNIGIAVSDEEGGLAVPFGVLKNVDWDEFIDDLTNIIRREHIEAVVVGIPLTLEGHESAKTREVKNFTATLKKFLDMPIDLEDERLTSRLAGDDHAQAASYILQSFLDRARYVKTPAR